MNELLVLLDGREVGIVRQLRGRLSFTYAQSWQNAQGAYPLSLSMPLAAAEHPHAAIEPFIWGLLPDNELVLSRWAQKFHVSARNAFALISQVGEDCAGAVQFVSHERHDELTNAPPAETQWLTETDVADRLRKLRTDASAGRTPSDTGQFSLAGAQPKTALLFDGQRWGVPSGRTPTTQILKPPTSEFDGHAENEHLCLRLANALGLPTAQSETRQFEDVSCIVVERYDRVWDQPTRLIKRVHQEDFCQTLSIHPALKYQNQGGPGPKQIVEVLRTGNDSGDVATFIEALIFNWLIGGTDAHAKNYSRLIGGGGMVRLAPLYDIASILPYPNIDLRKAKLAMKIGDHYGLTDVGLTDWRKLAKTCRLNEETVISRIKVMARELPDRLSDEVSVMRQQGLNHKVIKSLANILPKRVAEIAAM